MNKELTKEDFLKVLQHIYPLGYAGDTDNWQQTWFVGWLGRWERQAVVEVNVDGETDSIVFWLVYCDGDSVTVDIATGYIVGAMSILMPNMSCTDSGESESTMLFYNFKK